MDTSDSEQKETQIRALAEQRWGQHSRYICLAAANGQTKTGWHEAKFGQNRAEITSWLVRVQQWELGAPMSGRLPGLHLAHMHVSSSVLHSCSYSSVIKFCLPCQNSHDVLQFTHGNTISVLESLNFRIYINISQNYIYIFIYMKKKNPQTTI